MLSVLFCTALHILFALGYVSHCSVTLVLVKLMVIFSLDSSLEPMHDTDVFFVNFYFGILNVKLNVMKVSGHKNALTCTCILTSQVRCKINITLRICLIETFTFLIVFIHMLLNEMTWLARCVLYDIEFLCLSYWVCMRDIHSINKINGDFWQFL